MPAVFALYKSGFMNECEVCQVWMFRWNLDYAENQTAAMQCSLSATILMAPLKFN